MERASVCFKMARVQIAHAVQRLWPNRRPVRRVPTIHAILKNYGKYRQHSTSLRERSLSIEQGGGEDSVKICGKISGPNILVSENPIPQQKSQHKFHAPTNSTPVSLTQ